jgi:hypothetical protein
MILDLRWPFLYNSTWDVKLKDAWDPKRHMVSKTTNETLMHNTSIHLLEIRKNYVNKNMNFIFFGGKLTLKTWHEGLGELLDFSTIPIYQNQDVIINEPSIWKIRFINKDIIKKKLL